MEAFKVLNGKVLLNGKSYSEVIGLDKEHFDMKVRIERTKTLTISKCLPSASVLTNFLKLIA